MDFKSGNVSMSVRPAKEFKTALICIGFKASGSELCLRAIGSNSAVKCDEADDTAVLYALFMHVREKLGKNLAAEIKSKISYIECAIQDGYFNIYIECDASGTTIRKTLGGVFAGLDPAKARSMYKQTIRAMGAKPDDDAFDAVANSLISSIKNHVKVVVGGKAFGASNKKKDVMEECLKKAADKLDPSSVSKGSSRKETSFPDAPDSNEVFVMSKTGDPASVVVGWMFGKSFLPNLNVTDRQLVVHKKQETAFMKLGDKKDYIQKKAEGLMKLDEPGHALAAIAIKNCLLSVEDIKDVADTKITAANLASGVTKMF